MKKTYYQPSVMMEDIEPEMIICGSQDITSTGDVDGIEYGGADEDGKLDPASRQLRRDVWDE